MNDMIKAPFWHPAAQEGFILDWDGVLADTRLDFSPIRNKYFNGEIVPLIERAEELPSPLCDEVKAEIRRIEIEGAARAVPIDGASELIAWLNGNGKPWCVVSRNCRDSIELAAKTCGITLPDIVMCREDVIVKPDPRALKIAAERLSVSPQRCLMVGDFIYDMLGARRAGVRAALVGGDTSRWGSLADAAFGTMRDFVSELRDPKPLIPWEYRYVTADNLKELNERERYAKTFEDAMSLIHVGCVSIAVPYDAKLSACEWEQLDISHEYIDCPLADVINAVCAERWPLAKARRMLN